MNNPVLDPQAVLRHNNRLYITKDWTPFILIYLDWKQLEFTELMSDFHYHKDIHPKQSKSIQIVSMIPKSVELIGIPLFPM